MHGVGLVVFLDVDLDLDFLAARHRDRLQPEALAEVVEQVVERVVAGDVCHGDLLQFQICES